MAETMTSYERIKRMFEHKEADRVPITDSPWGATLERWHHQGLPEDTSFVDYFGLDKVARIGADNSPRYPVEIIEESDEFVIRTDRWGTTQKNWKHSGSTPEFLDYRVKDPETWADARKRMKPDRDRINWDHLEKNFPRWRDEGHWIEAGFWFGFDVTHAWMVGTERVLVALAMQPEWVMDMFNHYLEVDIALFNMVWDAGYRFDAVHWPDDMGYKYNTFFSLDMYREMLKPFHRRAADWAHQKGIKVQLHSCGDVHTFIPDLIEIGIDMLNPLEVKAGMDPIALKKEYGDRLALHGGLNALLYNTPEKMWDEMRRVIPEMKKDGGYWIGSDHSVPDCVTLDMFRTFVDLAKELGSYG